MKRWITGIVLFALFFVICLAPFLPFAHWIALLKSKINGGSISISHQQEVSHTKEQVAMTATGVSFEPILLYLLRPPENDMDSDIGRYLEPITIGF